MIPPNSGMYVKFFCCAVYFGFVPLLSALEVKLSIERLFPVFMVALEKLGFQLHVLRYFVLKMILARSGMEVNFSAALPILVSRCSLKRKRATRAPIRRKLLKQNEQRKL